METNGHRAGEFAEGVADDDRGTGCAVDGGNESESRSQGEGPGEHPSGSGTGGAAAGAEADCIDAQEFARRGQCTGQAGGAGG
mgnify:CR=1 FL=1